MIDSQAFGLIVMRAQFYPIDVLQAIARQYDHTESIPMNGFEYMILQPKPRVGS
jgi:hypothetical protein